MTDRKKPGMAFWATAVVVLVLVVHSLTNGPASAVKSRTDGRERNPATASTVAQAHLSNSDAVCSKKLVIENFRQAISECGSRVLFLWNTYVATWRLHHVVPPGWEPMRLLDLPPEMEGRISDARI
jgi:hypothetical protein